MNTPPEIFKFMPYRPDFITNNWLRLTPRVELNDPYDSLPLHSQLNAFRKSIPSSSEMNFKLSDEEISDIHLNAFGVISFSRSIDNILMWSHYADGHKGMAIGFNTSHPFFKELDYVRYRLSRDNMREEFSQLKFPELFIKSRQWEYEQEWRMSVSYADLLYNSDTQHITSDPWNTSSIPVPCIYPWHAMVKVPKEAITSISIGRRVNALQKEDLAMMLGECAALAHVKYQQVFLNYDKYQLEFSRLR